MQIHKKILLVDDDPDDQLFFIDAVKELIPAIECNIANNGKEALHQLQEFSSPPSLIFLDLNMPYMNGFECLTELRKVNQYKEIPVIILSTSNNPNDKERTIAMGANFFVTKPPDLHVLKSKLQEIFTTNFHQ